MSFLQSSIILLAFLQLAVQLLLKNKNEKKIKSLQECPPEDVQIIMDHETWKKTSNYSLDKSRLSNWEEILGFLIFIPTFLFSFLGILPLGIPQRKPVYGVVLFLFVLFLNFAVPKPPSRMVSPICVGRKVWFQQVDLKALVKR